MVVKEPNKLEESGFRPYQTRYQTFWQTLNWKLPDGVLCDVWQVDRGNIRAKRVRLGKGLPRWRQRRDHGHPVFLAAVALEKLKSKKFAGPRPAGPYLTSKGSKMPIPAQISLQVLSHDDEGAPSFCLTIELLGAVGKSLSVTVAVDCNMQNPALAAETDDLGLQDQDRHMLMLAAYQKMVRFHGTGPTGGTIQYSRWVVPDITEWLRRVLYQPAAGRILRKMRRLQPNSGTHSPFKEFTESAEA